MRGSLKIVVLKVLSKKSMNGYEIRKNIEKLVGWSPSYGSLFPILNDLVEKKMVSIKRVGRKNIYSITKKGQKFMKDIKNDTDLIKRRVLKTIKTYGFILGMTDKQIDRMKNIMNRSENFVPTPNMVKLERELRRIFALKLKKETYAKIDKILKDTHKKIKSVIEDEAVD